MRITHGIRLVLKLKKKEKEKKDLIKDPGGFSFNRKSQGLNPNSKRTKKTSIQENSHSDRKEPGNVSLSRKSQGLNAHSESAEMLPCKIV